MLSRSSRAGGTHPPPHPPPFWGPTPLLSHFINNPTSIWCVHVKQQTVIPPTHHTVTCTNIPHYTPHMQKHPHITAKHHNCTNTHPIYNQMRTNTHTVTHAAACTHTAHTYIRTLLHMHSHMHTHIHTQTHTHLATCLLTEKR